MELADVADRIAMRYFRHNPRVDRKPDRTFVTQADTSIEKTLRERIDARYLATLIALERAGVLELGLMSAPALHERWHAVRGAGAWAGKRRLHVSTIERLEDAQVFYASRSAFTAVGNERGFDAVVSGTWRDRGFGDFWGYALVAEGAGEVMFEPELYSWDLAAPLIVIEEAGGRLTDFKGRRTYAGGNAVASNGLLHEAILEKLNSA